MTRKSEFAFFNVMAAFTAMTFSLFKGIAGFASYPSSTRLAITCAWISAAPSKMFKMRASQSTRLIGYSSAKPTSRAFPVHPRYERLIKLPAQEASVTTTILGLSCVDIPESFFRTACERIESDPSILVVPLVIALVIFFVKPIRDWLFSLLRTTFFRIRTVWTASSRLNRASDSVALTGRGPWLTISRNVPPDYALRMAAAEATTPVIVCANLKGGVGKTTTTANLAAAFAARRAKPVLAIDLDYQGSLSSLMFAGQKWQPRADGRSHASLAIAGAQNGAFLPSTSRPATWVVDPDAKTMVIRQVPNLEGISAFHDLADEEDRMKLLWAIAEEKRDLRYFLYALLHDDTLRAKFSMVLIDAPPRLTTACVQALAASNFVLIPTILDEMSSIAVGYFGKQLQRHEEIWPYLKVLGVVGSMVDEQAHERRALTSAGDALRQTLKDSRQRLYAVQASGTAFEFPYELSIPQRASFGSNTRRGISYCAIGDNDAGRKLRKVYDLLASEIENRMKL